MASFLSDSVTIFATSAQLFYFFDDMNNFRHIMPEQVEDWHSDEESCSFFIKNLGKLGMNKCLTKSQNSIEFLSSDVSKVKFTLIFHFKDIDDRGKQINFEVLSEMNSFVEMMAKRPLTNFVNILAGNLKQQFGT